MQIGSIDFPDDLLTALEEDRLVVFAGAGVSRDAPSCLPLFPKLVEKIVRRNLQEEERGQLDRVLGRAQDQGEPVHRRAAALLDKTGSRFNSLHESLVGLFGSRTLRIVTTNFDRHFEGAISDRGPATKPEVYAAPALPVGSKFEGLVHLHGVLGRSPEELVLTDADFGRAYLTEGWAGRFVVDLFREYTILFVGYGYSDTVMSYLTRGLAPTSGKGRFGLTVAGEKEKWELLGIQAIEYDAPSDDHRALSEALRAWVRFRGRGFLEWSQRLKSLLKSEPEGLDPGGVGELEYCLRSEQRRHLFYTRATDPAWLDWAASKGLLAPLFSFEGDQERLRRLALWFTEDPLGPRGKAALRIASKTGCPVGNALAVMAAQQVLSTLANGGVAGEDQARRTAAWAALLIERTSPTAPIHPLSSWLDRLSPQDHPLLVTQILGHLLHCSPRFEEESSWRLTSELKLSFSVDDSVGHLNASWQELRAHIRSLARPLVSVLFEVLEQRWRWQATLESSDSSEDWWSLERSWVLRPKGEDSELRGRLNRRRGGSFLDIGRDVLDELLASAPVYAAAVVELWLAASAPQLVQLGLYGFAKSKSWRPREKLDHLLAERLPAERAFKSEVFRVLAEAYPLCSNRHRNLFLVRARRLHCDRLDNCGVGDSARSAAYRWYNLLAWLKRAAPLDSLVDREIAAVLERFPDFKPRKHLDLDSPDDLVVSVRKVSPLAASEIIRLSPADWLAAFEETSASAPPFGLDPSGGLLAETARCAAENFKWSLSLARTLIETVPADHAIWPEILGAWETRAFTSREWYQVLEVVVRPHFLAAQVEALTRLIRGRAEQQAPAATVGMIRSSIRLAEKLLALADATPLLIYGDDSGWLDQAVNHPGGQIAEFATRAVGLLLGPGPRTGPGLPRESKELLGAFLRGKGTGSAMGRLVLASQLHYFQAVDSEWTVTHLVPLFDWDRDPLQAGQAWHGFLGWGRPSAAVMEALNAGAVQLASHLEELAGEREKYGQFVAVAASSVPDDPLEKAWFKAFLEKANDEDRARFAWEVGSWLESLLPDQRAEVWTAWLGRYLELRARLPPPPDVLEFSALVGWVAHLAGQLEEVVPRLENLPGSGSARSDLLFELEGGGLAGSSPDLFGRLVLVLLKRGAVETRDLGDLYSTIERLMKEGARADRMRDLIEKYMELGGSGGEKLAEILPARSGVSEDSDE